MPNSSIDIYAVKQGASSLLHTARVRPTRFFLLFLALDFVIQMVDTIVSAYTGSGVTLVFLSVSFLGVLATLLSFVLSAGFVCYGLCVCRGEEAGYDFLFDGFSFPGKLIAAWLLQGAMVGLGLTFFIVPGIALAYTYAMTLRILCDDPSIGVIAAMRRSRELMAGHKMELLRLHLQFLPQILLFAAVLLGLEFLLPALLPETPSGDIAFNAIGMAATDAVQLLFYPCLSLAMTKFYLLLLPGENALPEQTEG